MAAFAKTIAPHRSPHPVVAAATFQKPAGHSHMKIATTGTITTIPVKLRQGESIYFTGADSGNTTLTNNAASTTLGQMDLGSGNITLEPGEFVHLRQDANGVWKLAYYGNV